jgi:hypothetical protein
MNLLDFQAIRAERLGQSLAFFVSNTPKERLNWRPKPESESKARSILDMSTECVLVNRYMAALLKGENPERPPAGEQSEFVIDDPEVLCQELVSSSKELADAISQLKEEDLDRDYPHWRGPLKGITLIEMPCRNMEYHGGQINYIQTLYGDTEFRVPKTWR